MIVEECAFNPAVDIAEVDQFGFLNLREAYETHTVMTGMDFDDLSFNDIEDPNSILGTPRDVFEAIEMGKYVIGNGASQVDANQSPEQA